MITSTILAALANPEPIAPGQSPIPVVIIQQGHEGMSTGELWVTGSTIALAAVTALTAMVMIYEDHKLVTALVAAIKALVPPYRRTLPGRVLSHGTDNAQAEPVNKIIKPRV